jgi:hypothetical protein
VAPQSLPHRYSDAIEDEEAARSVKRLVCELWPAAPLSSNSEDLAGANRPDSRCLAASLHRCAFRRAIGTTNSPTKPLLTPARGKVWLPLSSPDLCCAPRFQRLVRPECKTDAGNGPAMQFPEQRRQQQLVGYLLIIRHAR